MPDILPIIYDSRTIHCLILGYTEGRPAILSGPPDLRAPAEPEEIDWMLCTKDGTELLQTYDLFPETATQIEALLLAKLHQLTQDSADDAAIEAYRYDHGI